jgi:hypothetical protein
MVGIIASLIFTALFFVVGIFVFNGGTTLEYEVTIHTSSDNEIVVFVPAPVEQRLREELTIKGAGTMSIVPTEHGEALKIVFRGNVTVRSRVDGRGSLQDGGLTMEEQTSHSVWMGLENQDNGTQEVRIDLHNDHYRVEWGRGYGHGDSVEAALHNGWDTYLIRKSMT